MNKTEIYAILEDWNFWTKDLEIGVKRQAYIDKFSTLLNSNVVVAVIGPRRSGKSFLMRQVIRDKIERGIKRKNLLMINFEDIRFGELSTKLIERIFEVYQEYLMPDEKPIVFLDEVQNVPGWERWVRTMHELGKAKIVVSGSTSHLMRGELSTLLTGRHLDIFVYPFSFEEFLFFRQVNGPVVKQHLGEYMEYGGFPEVIKSEEKKQLLLTYFEDVLTKDIERRHKLRSGEKLKALARFYMTSISSPTTFNSIGKSLAVATNTIEKFSSYMEEVNLLFFLKRFSFKVKEHEKAPRKVYSVDVGLANSVGFNFLSNLGRIAENIVAMDLRRRTAGEVFYWHGSGEVDFVVKEGNAVKQLIQVCWNMENAKTKMREIRSLVKAGKALRCFDWTIITEEDESEEKIGPSVLKRVPLWKWLLSKPLNKNNLP